MGIKDDTEDDPAGPTSHPFHPPHPHPTLSQPPSTNPVKAWFHPQEISTHVKEEETTALALVSADIAAAKKTAMTKHARNTSVASSTPSA